MTDFVISGLIRRRRELTGDMLELLGKVDALAADVAAIDKVLGMFAPNVIPQAIPALQSRPKPDWAMRGEVSRIVMALLRASPEPLPTAQIAAEIHQRRGLEGEVTRLRLKRVRKCLDRQRARGALGVVLVDGRQCWRIAQSGKSRELD
jgi:hypothetical protein